MDRNEQVLSLIGLCLRGRNLEVGEEPVEAVSRARDARVIPVSYTHLFESGAASDL